MSSEIPIDGDPERDDDMLAAEYALHLLGPADRAAFEQRLAIDGALRETVARWTESFAAFAEDIPSVEAPPAVRARLVSAIAPTKRSTVGQRGLSLWRLIGGAGLAAALALALFVFLPLNTIDTLSPATYIANMQSDDSGFVLLAGYHPDEAALVVKRSAGDIPEGRVLELWLIAADAPAPVSLGTLPDQASVTLTLPEDLRDSLVGATLAITDEPPGGSPTGGPTGTVLAAGLLTDA
jgi:anti-sigma-K factor RskA